MVCLNNGHSVLSSLLLFQPSPVLSFLELSYHTILLPSPGSFFLPYF